MRAPRVRIAWVMVAIAFAAIDFAAIGAILASERMTLQASSCYWVPCRWRTFWRSAP